MIINFSIQNFGIIKEKQTLSFEATKSKDLEEYYIVEPKKGLRLLKLALIYGANASGKSTVLKALDFLRDLVMNPLDKKSEIFDFKPFLFDDKTPQQNSFFSLEFISNKVRYLYETELNKKAIVNEKLYFFKPNKALVFERKTNLEKQLSTIDFGSKIKINKEHKVSLEANTLWNNTVLGAYLKTNFESTELQEVVDWFKNQLKSLIKPRTNLLAYISSRLENNEINKKNIVKFLKKADFKISDIVIEKNELDIDDRLYGFLKSLPISEEKLGELKDKGKLEPREIFFIHEIVENNKSKLFTLPYTDESEGTQRYYQFSGLLELMIRSATTFSIDELESSLHADLLKHFLITFLANAKNSQLIATTHHRELLMEKDIFRNDAIWFTEKQTNGQADLYSLADFDSSVIRDTSSVYNAYKIGKLGAVPNLGDYFIDFEDDEEL